MQMSVFLIILGTILGAGMNRLRGTKSYLVWAAASTLAISIYILGSGIIPSLAVAAAYVAGESFGWTRWVHGAKGNYDQGLDTGTKDGSLWITKLIADEKDKKWFHQVGMSIRGLYWWTPVFLMMWWFGATPWWMAVGATVLLSLLFFPVYRMAFGLKWGDFKYLQKAEMMYGALYGAVIALALVV